MKKEEFSTPRAFSIPGRYSQVIKYGNIAFLSGQVAMDPQTGARVGESVGEQTRVILDTIHNILTDMGLTLDAILMMQCFLTDISKMKDMNAVYEEYFQDVEVLPARCTVQAGIDGFDLEICAVVGLE